MRVSVDQSIPPSETYASARTRSLYNVGVEDGSRFRLEADIPVEREDWQIGVVVGPSGSGKSSILRELAAIGWWEVIAEWGDGPIIDILSDRADYAKATASLSAVGLGSVPSWLRPRSVLSMGEGFRADLAQLLLTSGEHDQFLIDEFTSVLDRQVACVASGAFAKSWRRKPGRQVVIFACHYDILDWLEPDWYIDTADAGGGALPGEEVKVIEARQGCFREADAAPRYPGDYVGTLVV